MAEAIMSAVVGDMVSRAISFFTAQFKDCETTEAKIRRLRLLVIKIQSVVEEAERRQIGNHGLLEWLSELVHGMYQGRYLLDTFSYGALEASDDEHGDKVPCSFSLSSFNPAKRLRVRSRLFCDDGGVDNLDTVLENLQSISGDLKEFIMLLESYPRICRPLGTNIYVDSQMFGRHVERERIINFLLQDHEASSAKLAILPIIGRTSVGKTTLVHNVCYDSKVRNHFSLIMLFDCFALYPVPNSETRVVLRSKFIHGDMGNLNEPLQVLQQKLRGRRFLMVLENVDLHTKDRLQVLLPNLACGKRGSKIIVTSNDKHVASIGTVGPIRLRILHEAEYWFFFKAHAFAGTDAEENPRLATMAKVIAKRLKGSFFGAKIFGGFLRANPSPKLWRKVLESGIVESLPGGDGLPYIADVADNILPDHVNVFRVTICSSPPATYERKFADMRDLYLASPIAPLDGETSLATLSTLHVLLCKSVSPFFSLYYTADCTIG